MTYAKAIYICERINQDDLKDPPYNVNDVNTDEKLDAIEKILSMATINAVKKDTLLEIVRWFWNNCVEKLEISEAQK